MTDLISKSAVIDRIAEFLGPKGLDEWEVMVAIREIIENAPAVDAVPVVHARWIDPCVNKYGHPCHHCSACRFKASQKDRNFCPNCGAKMDAKED